MSPFQYPVPFSCSASRWSRPARSRLRQGPAGKLRPQGKPRLRGLVLFGKDKGVVPDPIWVLLSPGVPHQAGDEQVSLWGELREGRAESSHWKRLAKSVQPAYVSG